MDVVAKLKETEKLLTERLSGFKPEALLILGSGLGFMADDVENPIIIPYDEIPHFKGSTAPGHAGRLVSGTLEGKRVSIMQGRVHYYEGYAFSDIVYPIHAVKQLGADTVLLTNAAGGVNLGFSAGDLMLITDHIKFFDESPLRGPNDGRIGPRFPDMSYVYTPELLDAARRAARSQGMALKEGVYMFFPGPQYETPAEIRAARILGADAVGMSTVPEAIAAAHAGMKVLGISLISNMAAGVLPERLSEEEVLAAAASAREGFSSLIRSILREF